MATFYYVKGKPGYEYVQNAQAYELWKGTKKTENGVDVFVPSGTNPIETQQILQQLQIVGSIGANGNPAERKISVSLNIGHDIVPITKLTPDGYVYYVKADGHFDMLTSMSHVKNAPFKGTFYFQTSTPIQLKAKKLMYSQSDKAIQLVADVGYLQADGKTYTTAVEIKTNVWDVDLGDAIIQNIYPVDGGLFLYGAHTEYRRTDFIPIDALTDNLIYAGSNGGYNTACVGPFQPDGNAIGGFKIAFYSGMSHSTFKKGLTWSDFQEGYLTAEYIKELRDENASGAKYVIFSSQLGSPGGEKQDFVSLGGINFLLTGNNNFTNGETVVLGVKAKGDGKFFSDSEFSNPEVYTHTEN